MDYKEENAKILQCTGLATKVPHILIKVHWESWTQESTRVLLLDNCSKPQLHFVVREMGVLQSLMLKGASTYMYGTNGRVA